MVVMRVLCQTESRHRLGKGFVSVSEGVVGCGCYLVVDGETEHSRAHEGGGEGVHHTLVANLGGRVGGVGWSWVRVC